MYLQFTLEFPALCRSKFIVNTSRATLVISDNWRGDRITGAAQGRV